jgi:hypothetical protein
VLLLVGWTVAVAPSARAEDDPHIGCRDEVTQHIVGRRLHALFPKLAPQQTIYAAGPDSARWWYLETNGEVGLQRNDNQCENRGSDSDTVVFTTRILCTCDYPFGGQYLPWTLPPIPSSVADQSRTLGR